MANKYFGTDGVRGVANEMPLTADFVFKLAAAAGSKFKGERPEVAIGRDTRVSGDMLEAALMAGFTSQGVNVVKLGILPTPALTWLTPKLGVDMAVMITASHNPYYDNGIKLINGDGSKLSDTEVGEIEKIIEKSKIEYNRDKIGTVRENKEAVRLYIDNLNSIGKAGALKGLKLVLDCANGAFSEIAPQVFEKLGADVLTIGNEPDGYNINRGCGSQHMECLGELVKKSGAALGIACDGDGDRIAVCDEKGQRLEGDQVIAFLAQHLYNQGKLKGNAVTATIWSNLGLEKFVKSLGLDFYKTAVGERYVIEKMTEIKANFGGEESGHMVLSDYGATGDAMAASLIFAEGFLADGRKMSEIFPLFERCPCKLTNIRFDTKLDAVAAYENPMVQSVITFGKQVLEANGGSVIVRKSGTEPMLKIRVEGEDENMVTHISSSICNEIEMCKSKKNR